MKISPKLIKTNIIYKDDCIKSMLSLPEKSIDICVTSPPYNLNINYNTYKDNKSREEYLDWINEFTIALKHSLKDDGHFWFNVGYSNKDPWIGMDVAQIVRKHFKLQNNFIWVKSISINDVTTGHFKPINSERYSNTTWEHLFHFTKDGNVKCDKVSVGVPFMYDCNIDQSSRIKGKIVKKMGFKNQKDFGKNSTDIQKKEAENELSIRTLNKKERGNKRDKGNSWYVPYDTISNKSQKGSHPAIFPIKLVEDCISFSNLKENSILIDPFIGSGTSAIAAINKKLKYIGYDIDSNYIEFANQRISEHIKK